MKSVKFLAALAIPAMFAACTNEDILNEMPQNNQEIVGAELIGTNIALNAERGDIMSRLTATSWETGDMLGLAWQAKTVANPTLAEVNASSAKIYANHMFVKPEQGAFTTKGNVYKGWHFAYWPYAYMENIADNLIVNVNPTQAEGWNASSGDRFDNAFYISAQHYLTKEDLDDNYQLKEDKPFDMVRAVNEFVVVAEPSAAFAEDILLNNLKIKSVKLETSAEVFASYGKVVTTKLPAAQDSKSVNIYTKDTEYDKAKTQAAVKAVLAGKNADRAIQAYKKDNKHAMTTEIGFDKNVYTNVYEAGLVTGQTNYLRLFTLPAAATATLTTNNTKIVIEVEGGTFTIAYNKNAEEESDEAYNNEAIQAIIDAYSADGYTRPSDGEVVKMYELSNLPIGLNVRLLEKNFKPVFTGITSYEEWKKAVALVDALGFTTTQTFTIKGDIKVNETTIKMPANNCPIKVSGSKNIVLEKSVSKWPENLNVENIKVQVANKANLTIADGSKFNVKELEILEGGKLTMKAGKIDAKNNLEETVTNNGTIIVNKYASIKTVANKSRVEIKYGGVVETTEEVGTIFYAVNGTEAAYKFNYLMDDANVNTFVVNENITLDVNKKFTTGELDDEYHPSAGIGVSINNEKLQEITLELNGGQVVGLAGGEQSTFAAINVLGGTNITTDVKASEINVVAGTLTMDATTYKAGTETKKYELDMKAATEVTVAKEATLVANATTHVNILTNAGLVKANADYIFHFNSGTNIGTLTGNVEECNCPVDDTAEVAAVKSTWTALNAVLKYTTYNALIEKIATFSNEEWAKNDEEAGIGVKFVRALNAWLEAEGYDKISESATSTFTKMHFQAFETATGYSFGLN